MSLIMKAYLNIFSSDFHPVAQWSVRLSATLQVRNSTTCWERFSQTFISSGSINCLVTKHRGCRVRVTTWPGHMLYSTWRPRVKQAGLSTVDPDPSQVVLQQVQFRPMFFMLKICSTYRNTMMKFQFLLAHE